MKTTIPITKTCTKCQREFVLQQKFTGVEFVDNTLRDVYARIDKCEGCSDMKQPVCACKLKAPASR